MADEWINEDEICDRLHVSRSIIRAERNKLPPEHVVREPGRVVKWQAVAAWEFASRLGLNLGEKNGAHAASDLREVLTVVSERRQGLASTHFANPRLIQARRASGDVVLVRVADSSKYQPLLKDGKTPMVVTALPSTAGNWWTVISREPRAPGRF